MKNMDSRIIALLGLITITAIGFASLLLDRRNRNGRRASVTEYTAMFNRFADPATLDFDAYEWLTRKSVAMQNELGTYGLIDYRPPGTSHVMHRYEVITNLLSAIRQRKMQRSLSGLGGTYREMVLNYLDTLIRYVGVLDEQIEKRTKDLRNPIVWFREGVQVIMLVPLLVVHWLGLVSTSTIRNLKAAGFFKLTSSIMALVWFLGTITGLFVRWDEFKAIVVDLWKSLR